MPSEVVAAVTAKLGGAEDVTVRHYAVKTVENVLLGAADAHYVMRGRARAAAVGGTG